MTTRQPFGTDSDGFDLDAYLARIGYDGPRDASLETLRALHALHPQAIAFENLDPLLGRPVRLDAASLMDKLVHGRRGGYCFEQNLLFGHALAALGFRVTGLAARVLWSRPEGTRVPRGHMLLRAEAGGENWIADVGFGALTLTGPLRLVAGPEQATPHETFRVVEAEGELRLEARLGEDWRPVCGFDLQEQIQADYEITSYYLSTHPDSHFRSSLIAARPVPGGRHALLGNRLTRRSLNGGAEQRTIRDVAELRAVLAELFLVEAPEGAEADAILAAAIR